ncbi:MAG TPA: hypothetical protein VMU04_20940 [Candidatus Acidoferrum sp.]|nr:hypothetical protein [Candidatus Acidoferrum sp.]
MEPVRRAVIDVGTNSVKLLVADVAADDVRPVREESKQTRLGHGLYVARRLQAEAIADTARAVAAFAETARGLQATSIRVVATSAAREALNAPELTKAITETAGLEVEIISGEQEAVWGFQGVSSDPQLAHLPLLLVDVGGGSTQVSLGQEGLLRFSSSFQIGSVRLLEKFPPADPPGAGELAACRKWLGEFLHREVRPRLGPALKGQFAHGVQAVGVGGTASILGRMESRLESFDRDRLEATRLSAARVSWHVERLWSMGLAQRREVVGLPRNRADVILMGTAIYEGLMAEFSLAELRISTRGLRFAAVMKANAVA